VIYYQQVPYQIQPNHLDYQFLLSLMRLLIEKMLGRFRAKRLFPLALNNYGAVLDN
jgi:hypothetical protein